MSDFASDHGQPVLPPDELRCVWMTAGLLSYQLCDRAFDCEHCPLDAAMRPHFAAGGTPGVSLPGPASEPVALERDRRYSRGHCWVLPWGEGGSGGNLVRVGLEPGLAAALLLPRTVVQPRPGDPVHKGEAHLWIVTEGGTFPIAAPVTGRLRRSNPALAERPHLIVSRSFDEGWLYEMEIDRDSSEMSLLLDAPAAERLYAQDGRHFREDLLRAVRSASAEAPALADGGAPLSSISEMLGPTRYFALLRLVYG